jgi:hypothetical protein
MVAHEELAQFRGPPFAATPLTNESQAYQITRDPGGWESN